MSGIGHTLGTITNLLPSETTLEDALAATPREECPFGLPEQRQLSNLLNKLLGSRARTIAADGSACLGCAGVHLTDVFTEYEHPLTARLGRGLPGTTSVREYIWDTVLEPFERAASGRALAAITDSWASSISAGYGMTCANPDCGGPLAAELAVRDPESLLQAGHTLLAVAALAAYREAWEVEFGPADKAILAEAARAGIDPFTDLTTQAALCELADQRPTGVPADWGHLGEVYGWDFDVVEELEEQLGLDEAESVRLELVLGAWLRSVQPIC